MQEMKCAVVTPERKVFDEVVEFVVLPLYDGELGVARNHSPLIGRLGYGELRVKSGGETIRFYVDGGFAQVRHNRIVVLTGSALPSDQVDAATARIRLKKALSMKANSPETMEIRDRMIAQARGQLRVAGAKSLGTG